MSGMTGTSFFVRVSLATLRCGAFMDVGWEGEGGIETVRNLSGLV